jgi:hypothetical protein
MSWIPVLATALGAVIGLGSGLLIDQVRSSRDNAQRSLTARRDAYVGYLSALHDANEAMRAVALGQYSPDLTRPGGIPGRQRHSGTRTDHPPGTGGPVIAAADEAFRSLRTLRDRIGQGEVLAEYEPVLANYARCLQVLRDAVRHDIGVKGSSPPIPL